MVCCLSLWGVVSVMFWWVVCLCGGGGLGSWVVFCGARVFLLFFLGFFCVIFVTVFWGVFVGFVFLDSTNSFFVINVTVFAIP